MNLIDCFKTFQEVTRRVRLSANARSLYIAILGAFNEARYPQTLNLPNHLLREMSSINAESSFYSARNALQNAGLIQQKKQVYKLVAAFEGTKGQEHSEKDLEPAWSEVGANLEEAWSFGGRANSNLNLKKNKETRKEEEEARAHASLKVLEVWNRYKGEKLDGGKIFGLMELEKHYGVEAVIRAIKKASESNHYEKFPCVTYNYFKKFLEGGDANDANDNYGQYSRLDEYPR